MEFTKPITVYSGNSYDKYKVNATIRKESKLIRNNSGIEEVEHIVLRIFNTKSFKKTWNVKQGDVIVLQNVDDIITNNPLTNLQKKYGKENVCKAKEITENIYNTSLDHIKIIAI